ncbi:MAG: hypothetical protein U0L05_07735 [Schaedlerella sp.]|nr:hypothetical protein [Schaedlerella sp.]
MKRNFKKLAAVVMAMSIFTGVSSVCGNCNVVLASETSVSEMESELTSAPNAEVRSKYSSTVACGSIRYVSQMAGNNFFYPEYWGGWMSAAGSECYTSCISMALSYIGINITPNDLLTQGGGVTRPQLNWGGASFITDDVTNAMSNYINGNGKYSPAIIHLNSYSGAGHYVMLAGQISENVYQVLDPAISSVWNITFNGNTVTYTINGNTHTDTVTCAYQYYNPNASILDTTEELDLSPENTLSTESVSAYGTVNQEFLNLK